MGAVIFGNFFTKDSALIAVLVFGGSGLSYMGFPFSWFWFMKDKFIFVTEFQFIESRMEI